MPRKLHPPKRRDMLTALRKAEATLREMGSQWEEIPGHLRMVMLRLADRLARLIRRAG